SRVGREEVSMRSSVSSPTSRRRDSRHAGRSARPGERRLHRAMQVVAIACTVASVPSARANEFPPDSGLDIYWIDVEGGAATLLVTPAGETILIDTGLPGERHASRIEHVVEDVVGAEKIDHLVVTHFDIDHYGGAVDLAKRVEIAKVWDPGIPGSHRFDRAGPERFRDYAELFAERRTVIAPGDEIPLRAADSRAPLSIR